jgi:hypothetical protein
VVLSPASLTVPSKVPGLPGISRVSDPPEPSAQVSRCTIRILSPTNFRAKDGMPRAGWVWSTTTVIPGPASSTETRCSEACTASHTRSRNAGSATIARTSSGAAS